MRIHIRRIAVAVLLALLGCTSGENRSTDVSVPPDSLRRSLMLRAEITRALPRSYRPISVEWLSPYTYTSGTIPGLTYQWLSYDVGPHITYSAVIAQRDTVARLLRTFGDWASVVGVWSPDDENLAVAGCLEAAKYRDMRHPSHYIVAYQDTASLPPMIGIPERTGDRLYEPVVHVDSTGNWVVEMWVARSNAMYEVSCMYGPATRPALVLKDWIVGAGLLFY
jgi:hypothetical protein